MRVVTDDELNSLSKRLEQMQVDLDDKIGMLSSKVEITQKQFTILLERWNSKQEFYAGAKDAHLEVPSLKAALTTSTESIKALKTENSKLHEDNQRLRETVFDLGIQAGKRIQKETALENQIEALEAELKGYRAIHIPTTPAVDTSKPAVDTSKNSSISSWEDWLPMHNNLKFQDDEEY